MGDDEPDRPGEKTEVTVRQYDRDGNLTAETVTETVTYTPAAGNPPGFYL